MDPTTIKPTRIRFDTEFEDDGLYAITFWFEGAGVPSHLSLARGELEGPERAYVEAEDQKFGSRADDLVFMANGTTVGLSFNANSASCFH